MRELESHEEILVQDIKSVFQANNIDLNGKKVIDIGGYDGMITIPLAVVAYEMGAKEVHVVDPRLKISDFELETARITGHRRGVENMPRDQIHTFDFATIFAYQNIISEETYPRGIAEILKPEGSALLAGRFNTSRHDELRPFFGQFESAERDASKDKLLGELNPRMYILSSPIHQKKGLAEVAAVHRPGVGPLVTG
jgi:hypothetical protein